MATSAGVGVVGLAVMGQNLARNIARHGFPVSVFNRTTAKTSAFVEQFGHEGAFTPGLTLESFVASMTPPRTILLMVKAGGPVDNAIDELTPLLSPGDLLIDGGNSRYTDTQRRARALDAAGLRFLGTGVSGGEEGALNGPSIMPGGSRDAYAIAEPVLTAIAARVDGEACCTYIGGDGAGHYVKMVHNGIEYADMQLIAEAYDILASGLHLSAGEAAAVFREWNRGPLESYLIDITSEVLAKVDAATGRPLVEVILDSAAQKGTGAWTSVSALELGSPGPAIAEAVFARYLSALRSQRLAAAATLGGNGSATRLIGDAELVAAVGDALYSAKIVAYAQGFQQILMASRENGWGVDLAECARIWRGGCIIRARFLDVIKEAFRAQPDLENLMLAPAFAEAITRGQSAWRRVVSLAVEAGIPTPALSSSLAYYDGYRRARGPASLIQGLRDYFGAHTYERIDRPGSFHTRWAQDGSEVAAG